MLSHERLQTLLDAFPRLTIALVGDLFLDRYLEIDAAADEPSIETGLTAYQVTRVRNAPGALGTVMNNLAALGVGRLLPVTVLGDDGHGFDLRRELEKLPVDPRYIVRDENRLTPTYTKPVRPEGDQRVTWRELNRLDVRTRAPLSKSAESRLLECLEVAWRQADGLIVLDQINETDWGVVNRRVRAWLERIARRHPEKLIVTDSRNHLGEFRFGVLKGNRAEALRAAGVAADAPDGVETAARLLAERTGRTAFITIGEEGILVARPAGEIERVSAVPVEGPIDIVGAGDSATAALVATLLASATDSEAAEVACLVASITVQQLGTTGVATPQQVLERRADAG